MKSFVIPLTNEFMNTAAMEVLFLSEKIKEEAIEEGVDLPKKIELSIEAASKLMTMEPVTRAEIKGMLDTIGGYFLALHSYSDTVEKIDDDRLLHAKELMRFADKIQELVRPHWGLEVLR